MSDDAAAFWDERYREREAIPERGPAGFLVQSLDLLRRRGRVLDLAMGTGRNALFLAERGYDVTGIDISPVAVERCLEKASELGVELRAVCADLRSYALPERTFDVILNFYYLQRDLCPAVSRALAAGGVLVFETFTTEQRKFDFGPTQDEHLLQPGELRTLFPELQTLRYREGVVKREGERGKKAVAGLVARAGGRGQAASTA